MNDSLEARLQTTVDMIPAHAWYAAPADALTFVNERCAELPLVYAIVGDFGGGIDVKSVPGEGSTFSIYLQLTDIPTAAVTTSPPEVVGR